MSYPVLLPNTPSSRFVPFGRGVVGLLVEFPAVAARVLKEGAAETEIAAIQAEIDAMSQAETVRFDAQQVEIVAEQVAAGLAKEGRDWCGDLREDSRQLAQYEDGAAVLQRVLVDPFPLADEIRGADLPSALERMSRAAARYPALLARSEYTPDDLAYGADLAARLRQAQAAVTDAATARTAATHDRDVARSVVFKRMQKLCGRLRNALPDVGKAKLRSLRAEWLPRQGASKPASSS